MKIKKIELEVDYIGGQGSLTVEEEKALSDFFSRRKLTTKPLSVQKQIRTVKRHMVMA